MAKEQATIAENVNLLPFSDVMARLADYEGYRSVETLNAGNASEESKVRVTVKGAELRAGYTVAKDAPDEVWMIPVWKVTTQTTQLFGAEHTLDEVVEISALDGSRLRLPPQQ